MSIVIIGCSKGQELKKEYLRQDNNTLQYEKCSECPLGMYSLKKGEGCLLCPMSTAICFRDIILLPPGYWRASSDDDVIYFCKNNMK